MSNPNMNPCGRACPKYEPGKECDCDRKQTFLRAKANRQKKAQENLMFDAFKAGACKYARNRRKDGRI